MNRQLRQRLAVVLLTPHFQLLLHACSRMIGAQEQGVNEIRDEEVVGDQQRLVLGDAVTAANTENVKTYAVTHCGMPIDKSRTWSLTHR